MNKDELEKIKQRWLAYVKGQKNEGTLVILINMIFTDIEEVLK